MNMKRKLTWLVVAVVVAALSSAAFAGPGHKCTASTQDCLNKMAAKLKNRGWVGIELDKDKASGHMSVTRVVPESPAVKAGFKIGDQLLALNGVPLGKEDEKAKQEMKKAYKAMVPGNEVTYTVLRHGKKKELAVTLGKVPEEVLAQWVGGHMLEHAVVEVAEK
jgi:S1-C subfamily serine protease